LINVEVVFGTPESQQLVSVLMPPGSTVADALEMSKIAAAFPDAGIAHLPTGIWGRPVERDQTLADGDRVEVYRELEIDPKEARRLRALD
jgi:putative ubiquitin-RnfH superfamily antitoxin RatB of RatAB toxin-antitoxin module